MKMAKQLSLFDLLLLLTSLCVLVEDHVHVHAQYGFISIDCGVAENYTYAGEHGFDYVSDFGFIDSGETHVLPMNETLKDYIQLYRTVRSFPNGSRNCYTLKPITKGNKYLIRASFFYGNYDKQNRIPKFDLYVGINLWTTISNSLQPDYYEIITVASMESISVCLQNTRQGTPFISGLELRLLTNSLYPDSNQSQSLVHFDRTDVGSSKFIRYPEDSFDRIWRPKRISFDLSSSLSVTYKNYNFQPPSAVMDTAAIAFADYPLNISWNATDTTVQYHVYQHFAEIQTLGFNETREFFVCTGDSCTAAPFSPVYLEAETFYTPVPLSGKDHYTASLKKTSSSTLPPILNAYEIYSVMPISFSTTDEKDVAAIINISKFYKLKKVWMGDPCLPKDYPWEGLACKYPKSGAPTIKSLDLSSCELNGEISSFLADLLSLETLDLSGNNLTGLVPNFLGDLKLLSVLNLSGNQLNGSIPSTLLERSLKKSLTLIVDNNPGLCLSVSCSDIGRSTGFCRSRKCKLIVICIAVSACCGIGVLTVLLMLMRKRRMGQGSVNKGLENGEFSYERFKKIANIENGIPIGSGAFGTVYEGKLEDGTTVAVKLLSQQCRNSAKVKMFEKSLHDAFLNEVEISRKVDHKNLVKMKGYCAEEGHEALILEYMHNKDLRRHLTGTGSDAVVLNWNRRIQIALDVACGLKYLHEDCGTCIVHRDLKPENVLLSDRLEAKIADFGLSRCFPDQHLTHYTTAIRGTEAYRDPEYEKTGQFVKASDVYSFGIILLELITGQVLRKILDDEVVTLPQWTKKMLGNAPNMIGQLIDERLKCDYEEEPARRALDLALDCTKVAGKERLTITEVITSLDGCFVRESTDPESTSRPAPENTTWLSAVKNFVNYN